MPIIFCEMKLSMIVLNVGICWGVWGGGGLVYKLIYMVTFPGYNMEKEKNEKNNQKNGSLPTTTPSRIGWTS